MGDDFTLLELPRDATLAGEHGWMFGAYTAVCDADALDTFGHTDFVTTANERAANWAHQEHARQHRAMIVRSDDPTCAVGAANTWFPLSDNTHLGWVAVTIHPDYRRQGLGTRLAQWVEEKAHQMGRTTLAAQLDFPATEQGPMMSAPDGGQMPTSIPGWQFASKRGWGLQNLARISILDLPVDPDKLARFAADSQFHADGYRVETWVDDLPTAFYADYAEVMRTVSADAPVGGLDIAEEVWDEKRVADHLQEFRDTDSTIMFTGAIHEASGHMVAHTSIRWSNEPGQSAFAFQWETGVAAAHRGHRLGMWIKATNLIRAAELRPDTRRLYTWNASQNAHMLAINVALGFYPFGGTADIQKQL